MKKSKLNFIYGMKGYSLIELVIAMGLMLIIATAITSLLNISSKSLDKTYKKQNLNSDISFVVEYIKDEISSSNYNYVQDDNIYFVKKHGNKYSYINYYLSGKTIIRREVETRSLSKHKFNKYDGKNELIDDVKNFYLKDMDNFYELYIESDDENIKTSIAKRNQEL